MSHTEPVRSADSPSARFRPDIQGLRAIAVLLVVLDHAGIPWLSGGYIGVDVFFVISGFVISRGLIERLNQTSRIDFARFYADRARRILPASLTVIVLTTAAAFVLVSPLRLRDIVSDAIAAALYVPNLRFAIEKTDYLAGTAPSPFQHFWSLGVEEQFYLLWPMVLLGIFLLAARFDRGGLRMPRLAPLLTGVVIASIAVASLAACLLVTQTSQPWAFFSLPTRAWELMAGAIVALTIARIGRLRAAAVLGWLGLATILASAVLFTADTVYPGWAAIVPVVGAMLVIAFGAQGGAASPTAVGRLLGVRPLVFVGAISYSLYLVHWPVLVLAHEQFGLDSPLPVPVALVLLIPATFVSYLLFRFVERPFRRRGQSAGRGRSRRVLASSAAATVMVLVILAVAEPSVAMLPLSTARAAAASSIAPSPHASGFVPSNLAPTLSAATTDTGELYTDGCQQGMASADVLSCSFGDPNATSVIALFGDSHAGRWFPALKVAAAGLGSRLETFTKSGCRSVDTIASWTTTNNPACAAWRKNVLDRLHADPPTVIVLANHLGPTSGKAFAAEERDWEGGFSSVVHQLPEASRVVTIADSPEFASSPVLCLSAHLSATAQCSVARARAFNHAIDAADHAVSRTLGTGHIDLRDYFCDATECPPIIGRTLVYSDEHHITATFSAQLGRPLERALAPYLPSSHLP